MLMTKQLLYAVSFGKHEIFSFLSELIMLATNSSVIDIYPFFFCRAEGSLARMYPKKNSLLTVLYDERSSLHVNFYTVYCYDIVKKKLY